MQKLVRKDGIMEIDDPGRWQDNPDTIQFASSITSAESMEELLRVSKEVAAVHSRFLCLH